MDRIASPEEKIRRAEEIYYRRRNQTNRNNVARVNVNEQKNYGLFKKLVLQILICLVIYFIFYLIQNGNYIFSEEVINKTKEVLSYDINIPQVYEQAKQFIETNVNFSTQSNEDETDNNSSIPSETNNEIKQDNSENNNVQNSTQEESQEQSNNSEEQNESQEQSNNSEEQNENKEQLNNSEGQNFAAMGGADFEDAVLETKTQEQLDTEYLQTFSWTKPVSGTVTSEFGKRESTSSIISSNHTGIDIGTNTGTVIIAATEGTVAISSTVGEYGYHIKINNKDISTLYAHCSKLYVKVGDYVQQGQAIAEVGSTGNSTGPHLHFEIMREGRYINPRNVLQF